LYGVGVGVEGLIPDIGLDRLAETAPTLPNSVDKELRGSALTRRTADLNAS